MMKLQLDNEALTKLIELCGGDDFVLELRQGVVETVTKKHVKALLDKTAMAAIDIEVGKEVAKQLGTYSSTWCSKSATLQPEYAKQVTVLAEEQVSTFRNQLDAQIKKVVNEKIAEFSDRINNIVEARVTTATTKLVEERVATKIKEVQKALQNVRL